MKIIINKDEMTRIETEVYQGRSGGIYMNFGENPLLLPKEHAEHIANDLDLLDTTDFINFYKSKK